MAEFISKEIFTLTGSEMRTDMRDETVSIEEPTSTVNWF